MKASARAMIGNPAAASLANVAAFGTTLAPLWDIVANLEGDPSNLVDRNSC
jgi:hypothetical protein